jgi:hypothetical protein
MMVWPFIFYRDAARLMAADLKKEATALVLKTKRDSVREPSAGAAEAPQSS